MGNGDMNILNGGAQRYWEWLRLLIGTLIIPWGIWLSYTTANIDKRVAIIESNRFSSQDGMLVWQSIAEKANKADVPPQWFLKEFERLRDDFDEHKIRTREEELRK